MSRYTHQEEVDKGIKLGVKWSAKTGYPSFAQAGKDFDRFLEEAGGTRILPRVELDACFDQSIEPFIEQVQTWLQKYGDSFKK